MTDVTARGLAQRQSERLYTLVSGDDEDARLCADIPDSACKVVPGNFMRLLLSLTLTKAADALTSPKIVLAWLLGVVGAPTAMVTLLVPIRESGSLIPQLVIGAWVRQHARRKGFWVLGSVGQALSVGAMALSVWQFEGAAAGLGVLIALALFSLFRGLCSVAMKDVQGKCIPKARRGRLGGLAGAVAGLIIAAISLTLFHPDMNPTVTLYIAVLLAAAGVWLLAALVFGGVDEYAGETAGGHSIFDEIKRGATKPWVDAQFRRFVIARALLMCPALAPPLFILLAQDGSAGPALLGGFMLAASLASSVSSAFWGWKADDSSRKVMAQAGGAAALMCLVVAAMGYFMEMSSGLGFTVVAAYFILTIAHEGIRLGRKTYLVDMAGGNKRTSYVAASNTAIGLALLLVGGLSGAAATVSVPVALTVLGLAGVAGAIAARDLPEA